MIYPDVIVCGTDKIRVDYHDKQATLNVYLSTEKEKLGTLVAEKVTSGTEITGLLQNTLYYITVKLVENGIEVDESPVKERVMWVEVHNEGVFNPRPTWVFEHDDGTLYGIGGGNNTKLMKSVDKGDTWTVVYNFTEYGNTRSVFVTRKNVILQTVIGGIMRSADGGETFTKVLDFTHPETVTMPWSYAEDWDGVIYCGQYGNIRPDGQQTGYVNVAYLWRSFDEGLTWERIDFFIDKTDKHLHKVMVDRYTNRLYVTIGDGIKQLYYSDDKGDTWTKIGGDNTGFTGGTTVRGARFFSDDLAPPLNKIWRTIDDVNLVDIYTPDVVHNVQTYSMVGFEEQELWVACHNEFAREENKGALLRSQDCGLTWEVYADIDLPRSFQFLSFNRWGQSELDYVICSGSTGLIRIPRLWSRNKAGRFRTFPRPTKEFI